MSNIYRLFIWQQSANISFGYCHLKGILDVLLPTGIFRGRTVKKKLPSFLCSNILFTCFDDNLKSKYNVILEVILLNGWRLLQSFLKKARSYCITVVEMRVLCPLCHSFVIHFQDTDSWPWFSIFTFGVKLSLFWLWRAINRLTN